jgi:hypothetical protein
MGQKLALKEIDKRVDVKLNKSITANGVNGIMDFGQNNDYPQIIERLVNGSVTAKAAANIYSKFLTGAGFEDESLNDIVIGKDARGKEVTCLSLLRQISDSCAVNYGYYIKRSTNLEGETGPLELIPFKNCRFAKPDDTGYSAKIMVYENWEADKDKGKFEKNDIIPYHIFSNDLKVTQSQIESVKGVENFSGQIYFQFLDNQFFYPLSPFDPAYLDVDTEAQISTYKNRQIRNGFTDKIVFRIQPQEPELDDDGKPIDTENNELAERIRSFVGPDGETVLILEDDFNTEGDVKEAGAFRIDKIETNINDKLFENWEKSLSNNIRKAIRGIPAILIDYEDNKLGTTSGEAVVQATNFYNALTKDDRALISKSFDELYKNVKNESLQKKNWSIKPLSLIEEEQEERKDEAELKRLESQATLKGSVGGVNALIELQKAVGEGTADVDSAIEIVKEIYGISEDVARKMIGTPKETNQDGSNTNTDTTAGN